MILLRKKLFCQLKPQTLNNMEMNPPEQQVKPNNHMVMAIVSSVLSLISCSFVGIVPGIVSIVFASQVNSKYNNGDYDGAEKASKNAKIAWIISILITVAFLVYYAYFFAVHGDEFMEEFQKEMERQQSLQNQ